MIDPPPGVGNVWYVSPPGPYVIDPPPGVGNVWYVLPPGPYVSDPPPGVGNVWYVLFPGPYVIDPPPGVGNTWYVLPPGPYVSDPPPGVGNVWYVLFPGPCGMDPPPGVGNTWYVVPPGPYVSDPPPGVGNVWYVLWANASELRAVRRTTKLRYTTILGRISELEVVYVAADSLGQGIDVLRRRQPALASGKGRLGRVDFEKRLEHEPDDVRHERVDDRTQIGGQGPHDVVGPAEEDLVDALLRPSAPCRTLNSTRAHGFTDRVPHLPGDRLAGLCHWFSDAGG